MNIFHPCLLENFLLLEWSISILKMEK